MGEKRRRLLWVVPIVASLAIVAYVWIRRKARKAPAVKPGVDGAVSTPARHASRVWAGLMLLVGGIAWAVGAMGPDRVELMDPRTLSRFGCAAAAEWLSGLPFDIRIELLGFREGFLVLGSDDRATYVVPYDVDRRPREVYEVTSEEVERVAELPQQRQATRGVFVATEAANFACWGGESDPFECFVAEHLLESVPLSTRRRLYGQFDRFEVHAVSRSRARVVGYEDEEAVEGFVLTSGHLRPETAKAAVYRYLRMGTFEVRALYGRPVDSYCF